MRLSLILTATGAVFSQILGTGVGHHSQVGKPAGPLAGRPARERGPREAVQSRSHCARRGRQTRNYYGAEGVIPPYNRHQGGWNPGSTAIGRWVRARWIWVRAGG